MFSKTSSHPSAAITIIILLLAISLSLSFSACKRGGENGGSGGAGESGSSGGSSDSDPGDGGGAGTDTPGGAGDSADPEALWYYEEERAERYAAFAQIRPDLTMEDVVWMVDCDLDLPPYEDTHEVPDPNSLTLLVNKHFGLPQDYVPADLISVGSAQMRSESAAALNALISDAEGQGLGIWAQSGFRAYGIQQSLYNNYAATDGQAAADTYSARPGFSEHQTGLTVDLNDITDAFGQRPEGIWVKEHAWEYGFIIRYTEENQSITLYVREPWHLRYIGREHAEAMRDLGFTSFEEYWAKYIKHAPSAVG